MRQNACLRSGSFLLFLMSSACQPAPHANADAASQLSSSTRAEISPPPSADSRARARADPAKPNAEQHLPGYTILISGPWPGAGGFDDVVAAIAQPPGKNDPNQRVLTWYRTSETNPAPKRREYPTGPVVPTALAALDVNGDGENDLVVFASDGSHVAKTLESFTFLPERVQQLLELTREAAALDGARNAEEVRKLLPLTRGLPKEDIGSATPTALIGRISFASLAQFRELVGPKGLELCKDVAQNYKNTRRTCRRLSAKQIGDKTFDAHIKQVFENALEPTLIMTYECKGDSCKVGQPSGFEQIFEFSGTGAHRKLSRIVEIDQGIGE